MISGGGGEETLLPPSPDRGPVAAVHRRLDRRPPRRRRVVVGLSGVALLTAVHLLPVWAQWLERELRVQQRAMRVSTGGVVLLLAVAWVLVAVLRDLGLLWWLVAAVVLFAAWLRWLGRRQAARIRRLLDRTPDSAPTGVPPAG
jgi:Flp pilus assembly protein TadB